MQDMILKGFDMECRKFIAKVFEASGVTIHLFTSPTKIKKDSNGKLTLTSESKDGEETSLPEVDQILFATGRKPNTKGIGLESAGVELDEQGGVKVTNNISR
jgi:glutathione reductase (NADPH)